MTEALLTRDEAVAFFLRQLDDPEAKDGHEQPNRYNAKIVCHHYGKCELYDLIDAIYGAHERSQ